jgi:hypothetical protein
MEIREYNFDNIETIQKSVREKLKNISEIGFRCYMEKLEDRERSCVVCNGDYFD